MKRRLLKVKCENNDSELYVEAGTSLLELLHHLNLENKHPFIAGYVNNESKDLNYEVYGNKSVKFIDASHFEGRKIYRRTAHFMLYKAVCDIFPDRELKIVQNIANNSYFEIVGVDSSEITAQKIYHRIIEISKMSTPISWEKIHYEDAAIIFKENNLEDKSTLLSSSPRLYVVVNKLDNVYGYFYGTLAPNTSYIKLFEVKSFNKGFVLTLPSLEDPNSIYPYDIHKDIFNVISEQKELVKMLKIEDVGQLNSAVNKGNGRELIKIGEAFQERNFTKLADDLHIECGKGVKLLLITGQSSSGKTTFSNRLTIQLKIFGLKPIILSMDNYFVDRIHTPRNEKGEYNFEVPEAVDINLFNDHLSRLIAGEEVEIPKYDFISGKKVWNGDKIKLEDRGILVIEGIHAHNPVMTSSVEDRHKYKVYITPLSTLSIDKLSQIEPTDVRLIRRIVRDSAYRNHTAQQTIHRWGTVRRGEEKYILPFQKYADRLFDTFLFFEVSILKKHVVPLLNSVCNTSVEYSEARRLLKLLDYVVDIEESEIPPTSILREFIGGSSFDY